MQVCLKNKFRQILHLRLGTEDPEGNQKRKNLLVKFLKYYVLGLGH